MSQPHLCNAHAFQDAEMTTPPPRIPSMFEQMMGCVASYANAQAEQQMAGLRPWQFRPGLKAGSTTDRVLAELRRVSPIALEHGQLRMRCSASRGAVSWALYYLEQAGLVVGHHTDPRNPNYRKWRATK